MNDLSSQNTTDPAPATSTGNAKETKPGCPRCGGTLTNPGGLTWCPACGYCPLLEEKGKQEPRQTTTDVPSKLGAIEFFSVVGRTPRWLVLLLGGVFAVIVGSLGASSALPDESLHRVFWSLGQLLFGVAVVVGAHVWAIAQVSSTEVRARGRGSWSLLGLWRAAASQMPATRWPVNLLSWGLTLIFCALFIVGGFGWWVTNAKIVQERPKATQQAK
ncbi:MAG: hypothetical protein HYS12_28060 [Planctomycetes bacterium]|nr:hypothetical protein [Planctomycetota bacterium]